MNIALQPVNFRRYYQTALTIVSLVAVLSYVVLSRSSTSERQAAVRLNHVLQLQIQIGSINLLVDSISDTISQPDHQAAYLQELNRTIADLSANNTWLLNALESPDSHISYDKPPFFFKTSIDHYLQAAQAFAANPAAGNPVSTGGSALLKSVTALQNQVQRELDFATLNGQRIEFGILLVALTSMVAIGLFAFRPMHRHIERYEASLHREISRTEAALTALRQSETRYQLFTRNMPHTGVIMYDRDMHYTLIAGPFIKKLGMDERLVGQTPSDILSGERLAFVLSVNQRTLQGESITYERTIPPYAYQAYAMPLTDEQGQIIGGMVLMHDVTPFKTVEAALRASEQRLRLITDNVRDVITQADPDNHIVFASPSYRTQLGYEPDSVLGTFAAERIHPDDLDRILRAIQLMVERSGRTLLLEGRMLHADGHYIPVEMAITFMFDDSGPFTGWVSVTRDITERKQLENVLRENENRLRLITDNIRDLITQADAQNNLIFASKSFETELGYEAHTLEGRSALELLNADDAQKILTAIQSTIQNLNHNFLLEGRFLDSKGREVPVEMDYTLTFDADNHYTGWVNVSRDIRERKMLQVLELESQKLAVALDKELELSDIKSRMMERINHEFRTPLAIIQTSVEGLTTYFDRLDADQRAAKGQIIRLQIRRITDMLDEIGLVVNDGLEFPEIFRITFDLSRLCSDLKTQFEEAFQQPGRIVLDMPPQTRIRADETLIRNVIQHLLRNAIRFSEPMSPITIRIVPRESGVELKVIDQGIGILPQERERVFEPFFRGTNIDEIGGLGLGLTISRGAIQAHGGTLTLESTIGEGTTMRLWLPDTPPTPPK